jgi:regulator of protease activity HflC (stomatin/prohibitin superfamily)
MRFFFFVFLIWALAAVISAMSKARVFDRLPVKEFLDKLIKSMTGSIKGGVSMVKKIFLWVIAIIIIIIALRTGFGVFGTINAGERGVLTTFGAVSKKVYEEGLYMKMPFIQQVHRIDIKIQKEQATANAASKDLQTVDSIVAVNFHLNPTEVAKLYQEVGIDFKSRIIDPAMQEAVKASTAKYTAEELITKREMVREDIKELLKQRMESLGIIIDEFNVINFKFSDVFESAIEQKVVAEQQALAAKNKLEQVKFEAQQSVASAEGRAKAIQIEASALQTNPAVLQLRAIEKWNGTIPTYWGGGALPFINVK